MQGLWRSVVWEMHTLGVYFSLWCIYATLCHMWPHLLYRLSLFHQLLKLVSQSAPHYRSWQCGIALPLPQSLLPEGSDCDQVLRGSNTGCMWLSYVVFVWGGVFVCVYKYVHVRECVPNFIVCHLHCWIVYVKAWMALFPLLLACLTKNGGTGLGSSGSLMKLLTVTRQQMRSTWSWLKCAII